jgi:hypothetical protein
MKSFLMATGCALALAWPTRGATDRQVWYVAPNGNDAWSGRSPAPAADGADGPFATPARAQQALRSWRRASSPPASAPRPEIHLRGGVYRLTQPWTLEPADSGTVWRAYRNERPVLSGGVRVTGWQVGADGRWRVKLPEVAAGKWHFTQLFVNGQRRPRPRLPEHGYYHIAGALERTSEARGPGVDRFRFANGEIHADWHNLHDVEVLAFHNWTMSRLPVKSVTGDEVRFFGTGPSLSAWGKFQPGHRYLVENVKEALDAPGEWYLDRVSGELTYLPRPGETPDNTEVIAPRLPRLLVIQGGPDADSAVRDVRIEGLTFAHAAWPIPRTGQVVPQAEINLDGAISATGARNVVFQRCAVVHVGTYAMAFGDGCHDNRVESCELVDLGAGGVKLGATALKNWAALGAAARAAEPTSSHNLVRDCTIAHGGRLHPAAIGVWIGHSPYNTIEHNEIYDLYYSATSIGWIWGYASSHAHHNRVLYNHLHTLGQGVLSDMGAVYTLGVSPGTTVSFNVIHDVNAFDYGGWGLYTDEGSSGVVMENNLVYRTKTGGFHQHYGRENLIRNNIFAFARLYQLQRTRKEAHVSFTFERNLVVYNRGQLMNGRWTDDRLLMDDNLYWNLAGPVKFPGNQTLAEWRAATGHDRHSLVADPKFRDPLHDDFRLAPDSPASRIGFVPFDYRKAGRLTPPTLTTQMPPVPRAFE